MGCAETLHSLCKASEYGTGVSCPFPPAVERDGHLPASAREPDRHPTNVEPDIESGDRGSAPASSLRKADFGVENQSANGNQGGL